MQLRILLVLSDPLTAHLQVLEDRDEDLSPAAALVSRGWNPAMPAELMQASSSSVFWLRLPM